VLFGSNALFLHSNVALATMLHVHSFGECAASLGSVTQLEIVMRSCVALPKCMQLPWPCEPTRWCMQLCSQRVEFAYKSTHHAAHPCHMLMLLFVHLRVHPCHSMLSTDVPQHASTLVLNASARKHTCSQCTRLSVDGLLALSFLPALPALPVTLHPLVHPSVSKCFRRKHER